VQACKSLIIAAFILALAGCDNKPKLTYEEYVEAEAAGQSRGQRMAELEYLTKQAAVYSGCTFLINVCPDSITQKGKQAIEAGYIGGGGDSYLYWFIVIFKFLVLGLGLGSILTAVYVGWHKAMMPSRKQLFQAQNEIQTAKDKATKILHQAQQEASETLKNIEARRQTLLAETKQLTQRQAHLEREIEALNSQYSADSEKLKTLQNDLKRIALAKNAASNFD